MNVHIIRGRLTRDPEMVGTEANVAKFTVAVDDWDSQKKEKTAQFFDCVAFGRQAETIRDYTAKGRDVMIRGKQRQRSWEGKDGTKQYRWELIVDEVELGAKPAGDSSSRSANVTDEEEPAAPAKLW